MTAPALDLEGPGPSDMMVNAPPFVPQGTQKKQQRPNRKHTAGPKTNEDLWGDFQVQSVSNTAHRDRQGFQEKLRARAQRFGLEKKQEDKENGHDRMKKSSIKDRVLDRAESNQSGDHNNNNNSGKKKNNDEDNKNNNNKKNNRRQSEQKTPVRLPVGIDIPTEDLALYGVRTVKNRKKNTTCFDPVRSQRPADMRVVFGSAKLERFDKVFGGRDVTMVPEIFCEEADLSLYNSLLTEIQSLGINDIYVSWHGDTHVIANDRRYDWKKLPSFRRVVQRMEKYFDMDIQATRFNYYRDDSEWKPLHHDAAAVKPEFATKQNATVGASFGKQRDAIFQHVATGSLVTLPQPNGSLYAFGRDFNVEWKHGIAQIPERRRTGEGRISVIAWGWIDQIYEKIEGIPGPAL